MLGVEYGNPAYGQIDGLLIDKQEKTLVAYPGGREGKPNAIPEGIEHIGDFAFADCNGLAGVIIPGSVRSVGEFVFWGCDCLTTVIIEDGVMEIGYMAFGESKGLVSVTVPSSVVFIDEEYQSSDAYLVNVIAATKPMYGPGEGYDTYDTLHCDD